VPVLGLADRLHHRAECAGYALRFSEMAHDSMLERDQALFAPLFGHLATDAAVADEFAPGTEHRLAGKPEKTRIAVGIDAADLEIAERLARVEQRTVRGPAGGIGMDGGQLPARLA